jgi:hypothetical protein
VKIRLSEVRALVRSLLEATDDPYVEISVDELKHRNPAAYEKIPFQLVDPGTSWDEKAGSVKQNDAVDYTVFHDPTTNSFVLKTTMGELEWNGRSWQSATGFGSSPDEDNLNVRDVSGRDKRRALKSQIRYGWQSMEKASSIGRKIGYEDDLQVQQLYSKGMKNLTARHDVPPDELVSMFPRRMEAFMDKFGSPEGITWMLVPTRLGSRPYDDQPDEMIMIKGHDPKKKIEYWNEDGETWEHYKSTSEDLISSSSSP